MAGKLKDLYVKRNQNQYQPAADSWEARAAELNNMSGGAMPQGETAGNGAFGWLKDSADAGFFNTLGGTARLAGEFMPFGNDTFNSWADKADEIARRNSPQPGQNLEGMDYVASAVGNALGSGGASALEAGVVAGVGSLLGAGGVAGAVLGGASKVIPGVGKAVQAGKTLWGSPVGKYLVANVAGSPFEAGSEAGNLISDMRRENQQGTANYTDDEIRDAALRSGALNLAWLTGMNMLEAGTLGKITGALGGKMAKDTYKGIAGRALMGGTASGLGEGAEEYGQNLIGDYSKRGSTADFNYDEAMEAAKMGAIGGGVLGGLGSGLSAKFSKKNSDVSEEIASEDGGTIEEAPTEENFWENKEVAKHSIQQAYADGLISKDDARVMLMKLNDEELGEADKKRLKEREKQVAAAIENSRIQGYNDELDNYANNRESGKEAFINAIGGQESGGDYGAVNGRTGASGKYQIMPENWPAWAEEAGIGADAEMTPENQEIVARYKLGEYYDKYGARGAAIAWYAGEGALNYSEEALNRKQGKGDEPSINEYADSVLARMGNVADSARIDDTEENYFDESNYTDDAIPDSLNPVRGFDVSHLDKGTAQDRNSLLYGERVKKQKPAPAGEEVASFNQSLDNSNVQKAPNSLFVNSPRSWDAAERIYKARAKEQAERKARAQAITNIINARAAQKWDNAEQLHLANTRQSNRENLGALVPVNNAVAPQMSRMGHGELTLQNGRAQGLTDAEQAIINRYQGNPDAFNRKFKESVESVQAAVQRGDITQDVGRAYLKNLANMYDTVIGPIQNNGVIMQGQDAPIRKLVNKMRAKRKQGEVGTEPSLLQENGRVKKNAPADMLVKTSKGWDKAEAEYKARAEEKAEKHTRQQTIADIVNARAAQKWDEAETEYVSSKKGIDVALPEGVTAEAKSVTNKKTGKKEVELKFSGKKISDEFKKKLRAHGFNWNVGRKAWVAEENIVTKAVAEKLAQKDNGEVKNGKEETERIDKTEEQRGAEGDAGETRNSEAEQAEAEHVPESNQDEVNKKAVSKNANGIDKAKVQEVLEAISDTEVFDNLAEPTNIDKTLVGKSKEELYKIAIDNIKGKQGKAFKDPLGSKIYFAPGNTETIESYALHLIAGMGKPVEDIRVQRVLGVLLSDKTIQNPWAIIKQANGRKMYLSVYRGENSMTNGLIIGVEEGQDGRVVTSMLTANKKGDKKAALREFKKHVSGADEVLYIWEGLTGHSRPSSDQQASTANASLNPSGNQSVAQTAENVKKLNLPKGTTAEVSIVGDKSNIIQVKFNGEQGKGTGGIMGRAGYKWKSDKQVWQARKTEKAMDVAEQLGYTEEVKPQERDYELERTARQQRLQESNERATQSLVAQNKDESVPGKRYTVRNKFFSVTILDGVIRVKDASKINPQSNRYNFSLTVEEYQRAAQNGNRLAGISKLLKAKIREGIENWIEESPNERTKEVRKQQNDEAQIVQATDEHFENAYPLIEKVLQKAGIEALDHDTLMKRSRDNANSSKEKQTPKKFMSFETVDGNGKRVFAAGAISTRKDRDGRTLPENEVDEDTYQLAKEYGGYKDGLVAGVAFKDKEARDNFVEDMNQLATNTAENVVESNKDATNKGGKNNGSDITKQLPESDTGSRRTEDEVWADAESERRGAGDGQGSRTLEGQGRPDSTDGVHGSGDAAGRASSVRESSEEASRTGKAAAGSTELSGSVVDSLQQQSDVDERATDNVVESVADGRTDAADSVKQKVDDVVKENNLNKKRADRLRKTAKVMPFLSKIQFSNTDFVADRLVDNGKQGVMITDGTGTGKTFSGLAVAKEMVEDGKENILIVTPSDSVNNQWANAAKDFFGIELSKLDNIQDAGQGAVITTYANLGANDALIKRDWDLVICDESHYLMNNEQGEKTAALAKLRQLTLHPRELRARAEERILPEEKLEARRTIAQAAKLKRKKGQLKASEEAIVEKAEKLQKEKADELSKEERAQVEAQVKDWEQLNATEKPKVMFMSATPFAYVPDIDYAEGYLFDYPKVEGGSYNQPGNGFQQFMIEHFGYHMRYNKLTKPDKAVDNAVMEVEFHEWLRKTGALTGHELEIDKDYNRGFLLVDQGVGKKIDEGFEFLRNNHDKYRELEGVLNKQFDSRRRNYLLESIKARESIPIIQQYLKAGKKVVVFYETNVERESFNPFKFTQQTKELLQSGENRWASEEIQHEMDMFAKERPDLVNLNLDELSEPISIYREAFGDDAMFFNGRVSKNKRAEYVKAFNDDNSGKNLIFVQQDAGNAGISLHDTTGKHQRVLINIGIPRRPSYAIQIEGRIYRLGNKSNAIIRYLTTATNIENGLFAETVAGRASTAENLALGRRARGLRDSFKNAYQEIFDGTWEDRSPGIEGEDVGGKENDRNIVSTDSDYDRAKAFYFARGKKSAKNKTAEGVDYFATPEPIGYKMVQWAGLKDGDRVLEPSAGHGAISRFFSPNTDNTIIEPSSRLAPQAQMNTDNAKLINGYFEDLHIGNKYDAITMNPPFGTGGKTTVEHVAKAFKHLRNGGRVIAIIPRGAMADKRFSTWYESDDAKDAHMVGEVLLPGVTFERAGTKVATRIVIIDKGGESQGVKRIDLSRINNINELFDNLESVDMPAHQTKQTDAGTANFANSLRKGDTEGNSEVVTADSYKHTKTGEIIPSAKLNANLSDEEYRKVKSIAGKNGGYYSRYAKAFLFQDNETGRDKFVEEVNGANNTQYSVSSEAVQRAKEEVEVEIKKALPGAELEQREDGSYIATMPNGKRLGIVIEDQLLLNERQAEEAGKAHNRTVSEAEGYWSRWEQLDGKNIDGIIRVSRNSRVGTAFHETLHAAMDLCLTDKEKAALHKAFAKKAKESGRNVDEEIADAYKEWAIKRQSGQGSMFGKLFQKAKDFLNKLYTMFVEADNKGNIFRKLESGEAWKQQGEKSSQGTQYAVTNNAITGETRVPVIDVTDLPQIDVNSTSVKKEIAQSLIGKTFNIIGTNGIGKIANVKDGRHFVGGSNNKTRTHETRRKSLAVAEKILNNSVYIEKHIDANHDTQTRYIELYAVARNGDKAYRMRIVAKEGDRTANEYEVKTAKFYDIIEEGTLPALASQMDANQQNNVPSTVSVADLLEGVKGRDGKLLVNKNGGLNYNSEIFKGIKEPADYSVKYSVAPAKHKIANAFTNTERKGTIETAKDFIKEGFKDFRAHWLDKNDNLRKFDEITQMTGEMSLHQNVQNIPATAAGLLKSVCEGDAQSIKAANQHLKNVKMKHNVTLAMALNEINKDVMDKAHPKYLEANGFDSWQNAFGAYLGVERELEMSSIAKAQGETYKFSKGLTEAECRNFVANAPVQFRKAADMFYKVNDNVISIMEDAQVFSHDVAKALRTKHRKYCPLLRDFSDTAAADNFIGGLSAGGRGVGNVSIPLKAISIKGSERGVLNPLETVLKSYAMMINRAERNKVGLLAVKAAQTKQLHDLIKEVPEVVGKDGKVVNAVADPKNCIFTVLVNGKKKAYQTTQELYSPIVGYNLPAAGLTLEVARMTAQMLRTGATMSPSFIIRNLLRDTITAGFSSKNGFIPFVDTWRGFMALKNDPVLRAEFEAAGVGEFNFYGAKAQRIKSLDKMIGEHENLFKRIFGKMEEWSDIAESATRMGEFMLARKAGKSLEQAGHEAREVTVDFSKSGIYGEQINRYIPFFNACLQGGDKIYQLMREDPHGTMMKMFLTIVLPSALLYAFNRDKDWWKDLDPDIKNNYWCLSDKLRIPKPQEIGVLLGSGIEAFFEQASGRDKKAVSNVLDAFLDNMTPSIIPTLILPLVEWKTNYSYFRGQQLVSSKYQRMPDELQYNDYTSELSKGIGKVFKVSPMKVDNLVRGYTGTMGALLWSMAGEPFAKANNLPAKHFNEMVFVRDFNVTDANLSRPMNEFYGILDKANRQHAGYGVKGKPEAAVKGIRSAGSMISKIRKDIDKITHSNLTPDRKRELIDKRKEKMNQIAKQATARYGKYFE